MESSMPTKNWSWTSENKFCCRIKGTHEEISEKQSIFISFSSVFFHRDYHRDMLVIPSKGSGITHHTAYPTTIRHNKLEQSMPEGPTCGSWATHSSEAAQVSSNPSQGQQCGCPGKWLLRNWVWQWVTKQLLRCSVTIQPSCAPILLFLKLPFFSVL